MTQRLWLALGEGEIEQKFPLDSSDYVTNKQASEHATLDGRGDAAKLFDDVWAREGLHTVRRVREVNWVKDDQITVTDPTGWG